MVAVWLSLVTTVALSAGQSASSQRFELYNQCRPMRIVIEEPHPRTNAASIGLYASSMRNTVESRLRAANLYTQDVDEAIGAFISVRVNFAGSAFVLNTSYYKAVHDLTDEFGMAPTWNTGSVGIHGGKYGIDSGYIMSSLSQHIDQFLTEYLRVNSAACEVLRR